MGRWKRGWGSLKREEVGVPEQGVRGREVGVPEDGRGGGSLKRDGGGGP